MLEYSNTTIFNLNTQTIVNTVNCVGVMGAGIALECKLRFPEMYADYVRRCRRKEIQIGKVSLYKDCHKPYILNFPTKNHWKYPSELAWIEAGLKDFVAKYQEWGITSIAFPRLGCDRGGLHWSQVRVLMEEYLSNQPNLQVYICLDNETTAQGVEKQMLELLNDRQLWEEKLNLSLRVVDNITKALPLQRFRNLKNISGIGKETYQELFKLLYALTQTEQNQRNRDIWQIPDPRIRLIMFLTSLGFNAEEISKLTVSNCQKQGQSIIILAPPQPRVVIPLKIWQKTQVNLQELEPEQPLIQSKRQRGQPLKSVTIKKLINQGNKLRAR